MRTLPISSSGHASQISKACQVKGFSRFELLVSVILIGVLTAVLLDYSLRYQERAEKAVMEATAINIRSGLRLRVAELMMQDRMREIGNLIGENPVNWLEKPPANYMGSVDSSSRISLPEGSWYFDASRRELIYLPRLSRFFKTDAAGEKAVRFRVTSKKKLQHAGGNISHEGVEFVLINEYTWF